jgi:hypothetical protein
MIIGNKSLYEISNDNGIRVAPECDTNHYLVVTNLGRD